MDQKTMEILKGLKGRSLMAPFDFSVEELDALFSLGDDIIDHPEKYATICVTNGG